MNSMVFEKEIYGILLTLSSVLKTKDYIDYYKVLGVNKNVTLF